ncbi:MAG: 50S ribosomal protein L13 [Patescibacteria group bacterium]|nr:50S ribosomal protein L13 [Patescibacteria group bacterium]MDE2014940.1 50S ribosomal protein L13 [Patescibacteria group bacterium]MDE2226369.1 50S ribosomal protein L13 [Patescibacteria group bacterium]
MEYHIDAKNKILGRLASEIAIILQGKKNPHYEPRLIGSDKVFVKNCKGLKVTGNKLKGRIYYRHTGYMGHLKETSLEEAMTKNPQRVLREVVRHMLPKNFLNQKRLKNLIFVADDKS